MDSIEAFQASNRAKRQEKIDEEVLRVQGIDITKTVAAMIEVEIEKEKIKELLIKYWDIRPSEADQFIQRVENGIEMR